MSDPKKHHFVPQWLMRNWAQDDGTVIGLDRRNSPKVRLFRADPKHVNVQRHLYSTNKIDGTKDARLETEWYCPLDGSASELTNRMIKILNSGNIPDLSRNQTGFFWQFYFYNAYKRHPNTAKKYLSIWDQETTIDLTAEHLIRQGRDAKSVRAELEKVEFDEEFFKEAIQFARSEQSAELVDFLGTRDLMILAAPESKSFVLPDIAFHISKVGSGLSTTISVPIHPRYAVTMAGSLGGTQLKSITDAELRQLNLRWYQNATTAIATKDRLLISLASEIDGSKPSDINHRPP